MGVGLWTNLTPEGNRLVGKSVKFFLAGPVACLVGVGVALLLHAVGR
jgi:hypothetical protein